MLMFDHPTAKAIAGHILEQIIGLEPDVTLNISSRGGTGGVLRLEAGDPVAVVSSVGRWAGGCNDEAARWLLYRTAVLADEVSKGSGERVNKEAAAAILFTAEMATRVADSAVQIHGGYGYMNETPVSRYLRDAKLLEIGAGTSEVRRLLIGRELVGPG